MSRSPKAFFRVAAMRRWLAVVAVFAMTQHAAAVDIPRLQIYLLMGQSNMVGRDTSDLLGQA